MGGIAMRIAAPARRFSRVFHFVPVAFLIGVVTLGSRPSHAQSSGPSVAEMKLGGLLFADKTLSNPQGMSCQTCHNPQTGFTYPISDVNEFLGPVPGTVPGRFGNRKPPTISYATYLPAGVPHFDKVRQAYVGGFFWDGRVPNLASQAQMPFQNPNEMNNLVHNTGSPAMVVAAVRSGKNAELFKQVFGQDVFTLSNAKVFGYITQAIAAFETSKDVSPFTSKYDAYLLGKVELSTEELDGLRLFTGSYTGRPGGKKYTKNAQCATCHTVQADAKTGPDLFTSSCYMNIGVPKNVNNPYYSETNQVSNPAGYNPFGADFIDYGLGDYLYPLHGLPIGDPAGPDRYEIDGTFKAPTMRNVDKRPVPDFVKCYMHNGVFKSLKDVVHFYNTRNLTTKGEVIDYTKANPFAGLVGKPIWAEPELISTITLVNAPGLKNSPTSSVGRLGLSPTDEAHIVLFLQTLTDGYFKR